MLNSIKTKVADRLFGFLFNSCEMGEWVYKRDDHENSFLKMLKLAMINTLNYTHMHSTYHNDVIEKRNGEMISYVDRFWMLAT